VGSRAVPKVQKYEIVGSSMECGVFTKRSSLERDRNFTNIQ